MITANNKLTILIDADMLVFRACSAVETEMQLENEVWCLWTDTAEAKQIVDDYVVDLTNKVLSHYKHEGAYEILMCFTDDVNFRKDILPSYKSNRAGKRKPCGYKYVKQWVKDNFNAYQKPTLEADDCIGILATKLKNCVVISGDKDFKSIPCRFYNFIKKEFYEISESQADFWHLYQTLVGDTADGYKGCPGVGDKTAIKILEASQTWQAVVDTFESKGCTEEDALVQARVARILRKQDYDFKAKKPILWTPK